MLKSCQYCGRIHARNFDCGKKPVRKRYEHDSSESGRYTRAFTEKAIDIKERSNYLCEVCMEEGVINYRELETHHIIKLKERPELLLDDNNLICLCRKHHRMADEGKISAEHLRELAEKRDETAPGIDVS